MICVELRWELPCMGIEASSFEPYTALHQRKHGICVQPHQANGTLCGEYHVYKHKLFIRDTGMSAVQT
jgi:hypothetical protein